MTDVRGYGVSIPIGGPLSVSAGFYYERGNFLGTFSPYFTLTPLTVGTRATVDVTAGAHGADIGDFSGNGWIVAGSSGVTAGVIMNSAGKPIGVVTGYGVGNAAVGPTMTVTGHELLDVLQALKNLASVLLKAADTPEDAISQIILNGTPPFASMPNASDALTIPGQYSPTTSWELNPNDPYSGHFYPYISGQFYTNDWHKYGGLGYSGPAYNPYFSYFGDHETNLGFGTPSERIPNSMRPDASPDTRELPFTPDMLHRGSFRPESSNRPTPLDDSNNIRDRTSGNIHRPGDYIDNDGASDHAGRNSGTGNRTTSDHWGGLRDVTSPNTGRTDPGHNESHPNTSRPNTSHPSHPTNVPTPGRNPGNPANSPNHHLDVYGDNRPGPDNSPNHHLDVYGDWGRGGTSPSTGGVGPSSPTGAGTYGPNWGGLGTGYLGVPIILDIDGNGVGITQFDHSSRFADSGDDGLMHRTAWAARGDGVLFVDPDNLGFIRDTKQYVFTEWDPTATSDLEALRAKFDDNGDGILNNQDASFALFRVEITNADGSTSVQTLAQAGIASINLTADATRIELPDGSMITGQTTFTRTNGATGTAANTNAAIIDLDRRAA